MRSFLKSLIHNQWRTPTKSPSLFLRPRREVQNFTYYVSSKMRCAFIARSLGPQDCIAPWIRSKVYQFTTENTNLNGKLKVKLIGRKLYLPKELVEKAQLPENGDCEAILVGDEVRIRRQSEKELDMSKMLKEKPVTASIDHMARAQEVEDA